MGGLQYVKYKKVNNVTVKAGYNKINIKIDYSTRLISDEFKNSNP
jgi:hypothetical protein